MNKQRMIDQAELLSESRAAHLSAGLALRHWQCEGCGFDLHPGIKPSEIPDGKCPKCGSCAWDKVPKPPPLVAGGVPTGRNEPYRRKVRVPDPLPILRRSRVDERELAMAGGVRD